MTRTEDSAMPPAAAVRLADVPISALDRRLGITYLEASAERVVATMPVEGNTQPMGLLHGGASCALAESLGSVAATLHSLPERVPVGVDINATHHRGVRSGLVTGVATPAHRGRTFATYNVAIIDEAGQQVCTARITCFLRPSHEALPQPAESGSTAPA